MQKIIGFDIDGVLTTPDRIPWEQEMVSYFKLDPAMYPEKDELRERFGLSEEQMQDFFHTRSHFVFPKLTVREAASPFLHELKAQGFTIILITARTESPETPKWLARHDIPYDLLVHAHDKLPSCLEHGVKLFVEDNLNNAQAVSAELPVLLIDAEYNRVDDLPKGVFRMYNFVEVRQFVADYFSRQIA